MSNLPDIEKELQETSMNYLGLLRITKELDADWAVKLDTALDKVADALKDMTAVPGSVLLASWYSYHGNS